MPYRRLLRLSEGGMGQVDLCVREGGAFRRLYAMKRLKPGIREDADCRLMFVQEARLAGLVHHPNVVSVLDVGEDAEGPFLVMEYVEGVTANDVLRGARQSDIPIPISVCLELVAQTARGLDKAHTQTSHDGTALDLVHRDVSPHNILIDYDGVARVTDFGIARATGNSHHTNTGVLKGKLGYMAPEVLQFAPVDARTDIFALGVVLFELLTARRLYSGNDQERAKRIVNEPPPDVGEERRDVPPDTQALVVSMLAKDPAERPATALIIAERLEAELRRLRASPDYCGLAEYIDEHFEDARESRQREIQIALLARQPSSPAPVPRWALGATLAVLTLAVAGAGWHYARSPESAEVIQAPAPSPMSDAETVVVEEGEADEGEADASVVIRVTTTPPGAQIVGPGVDAVSPATLTLAQSDVPLALEIRRRGYRSHSLQVIPNADTQFDITLDRRPRSTMRTTTRTTMRAPRGLRELWD